MSNQNTEEKIFADGFSFKRKDNAPDFVVGRMSVKVSDAKKFLDSHAKNDWVNIDVKTAKSGKIYMELDTWEPPKQTETSSRVKEDLPF